MYNNMYTILHLPSNTYYAIQNNKYSVAMFKQYKDAKYVADSLATHKWVYGKLPTVNTALFVMKPYQKKQEALEHCLCVKTEALSMRYVQNIGTRNLNISLIDAIQWKDDHTYDVDIRHIELSASNKAYKESLELDANIIIED